MRDACRPVLGGTRATHFRGGRKTAVISGCLPCTRSPVLPFQKDFTISGIQKNAMNINVGNSNRVYWDRTAENYDRIFSETVVGRIQRDAVWHEMDKIFQPGMRILELNCGTGIDAVHLAARGVRVVACDLSSGMIHAARQRSSAAGLDALVDFRVLATED